MTQLIVLVGLVGSGKSTQAKILAEKMEKVKNKPEIIESDVYREKLYGNATIQGNNNVLFEKIHNDIFDFLGEGISVIFDATNISFKNRIALLQKLNSSNVEKICYLVATDIETCKQRNASRERKVPEYILDRAWKTFTVPFLEEGFNKVNIIFDYDREKYNYENLLLNMINFSQDNPHHSMTLGCHIICCKERSEKFGQNIKYLSMLHDIGKIYTKNFKDSKGNETLFAHFFNHENVSCYESIFYLKEFGLSDSEILYICKLILFHMRLYDIKSEKSKNKLIGLIGQKSYDDLLVFNDIDRGCK